jgi:hypothetical protein
MRYFNQYFKENDKIQEFSYLETRKGHIYEFNFTKADMVKIINALPKDLQEKIRNQFILMDFKGQDINRYINYLMTGHCKILIKQQEDVYNEMQKSNLQSIKTMD